MAIHSGEDAGETIYGAETMGSRDAVRVAFPTDYI